MILVIDYGMGNLRSVSKALEHLGGRVKVSADFRDLEKADKIVLPGVGAFGDAAEELRKRELLEPLRAAVEKKKFFLGICLGLQLMLTQSEESPRSEGLGLVEGEVRAFRSENVKIPHMGWNDVRIRQDHPLFRNVPDGSFFYFVHSFYAVPKKTELVAGSTHYGTEDFAAILGGETFFATQFHPEKSQQAGLTILKNFLAW